MLWKYEAHLQQNSHAEAWFQWSCFSTSVGCSLVNLLHIFRTHFPKNSSGWLLLHVYNHRLEYIGINWRKLQGAISVTNFPKKYFKCKQIQVSANVLNHFDVIQFLTAGYRKSCLHQLLLGQADEKVVLFFA